MTYAKFLKILTANKQSTCDLELHIKASNNESMTISTLACHV